LQSRLGIFPKLTQQPGNEAEKALDPENREQLLFFLREDNVDKVHLVELLSIFDDMKKDFSYIPRSVELDLSAPTRDSYEKKSSCFHKKLLEYFDFVSITSSLHALIDHTGVNVPLAMPMSATAHERGHWRWRECLENMSFKGDVQRRLDDSLISNNYLSSQLVKQQLGLLPPQVYHCRNCKSANHTKKKCPVAQE
jgi:hypothetical protein